MEEYVMPEQKAKKSGGGFGISETPEEFTQISHIGSGLQAPEQRFRAKRKTRLRNFDAVFELRNTPQRARRAKFVRCI